MHDDLLRTGKALAKQGRYAEAAERLEQVCSLPQASPEAWLALAACYFRMDRNDDCRRALRRALEIDPEHGPTRRFLKQITGSDIIPAADIGREKIRVAEQEPSLQALPAATGGSRLGCLGAMVLGSGVVSLQVVWGCWCSL